MNIYICVYFNKKVKKCSTIDTVRSASVFICVLSRENIFDALTDYYYNSISITVLV